MLSKIIDWVWPWMVHTGMPVLYYYHSLTGSIFLNVSASDAQGWEKAGNTLLIPFQYLFVGKEAVAIEGDEVHYAFKQRFDYNDRAIWYKTAGSYLLLPSTTFCGIVVKGISYFFKMTQDHHAQMKVALFTPTDKQNNDSYRKLGIAINDYRQGKQLNAPLYQRRPGDENRLAAEKEALREIVRLLTEAQIPFWVDCGTCLGVYRHAGVIPWDNDLDIAILQPDFENARRALSLLDPQKYHVQDWSSRDKPNSYLKVYIRDAKALIDIYNCAIDQENKTIYTIFSNEGCVLMPESWKIKERRCTTPVSYSTIFPLKKGYFDGILVPVPNRTKKYLQSKYGKDISPVKIYNEKTGQYEKDLSHPYWQLPYAQ